MIIARGASGSYPRHRAVFGALGAFLVLSSLRLARELLIFSSSFKYKEREAWIGEVTCPKLHGDLALVSVSPDMALPLPAKCLSP